MDQPTQHTMNPLAEAGEHLAAILRRVSLRREPANPVAAAGNELVVSLRKAATAQQLQALVNEYGPLVDHHRTRAAAELSDDDMRHRPAGRFGLTRIGRVL